MEMEALTNHTHHLHRLLGQLSQQEEVKAGKNLTGWELALLQKSHLNLYPSSYR
jgi:hypothetical protein